MFFVSLRESFFLAGCLSLSFFFFQCQDKQIWQLYCPLPLIWSLVILKIFKMVLHNFWSTRNWHMSPGVFYVEDVSFTKHTPPQNDVFTQNLAFCNISLINSWRDPEEKRSASTFFLLEMILLALTLSWEWTLPVAWKHVFYVPNHTANMLSLEIYLLPSWHPATHVAFTLCWESFQLFWGSCCFLMWSSSPVVKSVSYL